MSDISAVDGVDYDDLSVAAPNPGLRAGRKWKYHGQTGNTVAGNVANQGIGTVAVPALAAGAEGTLTITDSKITALSIVQLTMRRGTTVPGAGALAAVLAQAQAPAAGSVVVDVHNLGSAATLATDYQLWYWVLN